MACEPNRKCRWRPWAEVDSRHGKRRILWAYVAAEVELIIGLVTTALILIYERNVLLAVGVLAGFLILEILIHAVIAAAENTAWTRAQVEEIVDALREGRAPVQVRDEVDAVEDPRHWMRVAVITLTIAGTIVLIRALF